MTFYVMNISAREKEIVSLMAKGHSGVEISTILGIAYETVKTYRKRIYRKLGVNKKSECIKMASELRLV